MEVLLLQDINGIGKKNDLLVVGDGFALNYLLPKRAALVATPLVRKRYADLIRRRAEEREKEKKTQSDIAQSLTGKTVVLQRKASKAGKLYAAVTEKMISEALKTQHEIDVAADKIVIADEIKSTGTHTAQVKLTDQMVNVQVTVEAEKA